VLKRFQLLQQTQLQLSSTTVVGVVGGVLAIAFGQTAWDARLHDLLSFQQHVVPEQADAK
jgi:hypothetical protein